jgi:hypothetical protein
VLPSRAVAENPRMTRISPISSRRLAILAACCAFALVAGCRGTTPVLPVVQTTKSASAQVVMKMPVQVPMTSWHVIGSSSPTPADREYWRKHHVEHAKPYLKKLEQLAPPPVISYLAKNDIPRGDAATVTLEPIAVSGGTNGPMVTLRVTVSYRDAKTPDWTITALGPYAAWNSDEAVIARLMNSVIEQMSKAGFGSNI